MKAQRESFIISLLLCLLAATSAYGQNIVTRNRTCSVCKQSKPASEFAAGSAKCKACAQAAEQRRQQQAQKESIQKNYEMGDAYCYGRNGKKVNYAQAAKYYRKAAEKGHAKAQDQLGWLYHYGSGVNKDYAEAVKWYRKSAEQGVANAQNQLGYMYEQGYGVGKDLSQARYWYGKAAAQGNANGKANLKRLTQQQQNRTAR